MAVLFVFKTNIFIYLLFNAVGSDVISVQQLLYTILMLLTYYHSIQ
jgi:hypothetical protein